MSLLIGAALALVLTGAFSWFSLTVSADLEVAPELPVRDVDGLGAATQLNVTVRNVGRGEAQPTFWVMWSPFVRNWEIVTGDRVLAPGASSLYTIRTTDIRMSVPDGALYAVKVFDQASGVYFRSELQRLALVGTPPLRNPELRLWSRDLQSGSPEPFAWDVRSGIGPGDSASASPPASGSGAALRLHEDGTGPSPAWLHLQQPADRDDLLRLRALPLVLCWSRGVDYVEDPGTGYPLAASGVEVVGGRRAWAVLSSTTNTTYDLPGHRIFRLRGIVDAPDCLSVPLREMIDFVGTQVDDTLFILFMATWATSPGDHAFTITSLTLG